jgi:hypothetical protein
MNTPPILLLIFNRPDTTEKVFEAIRQAKPKQLFIAADAPRAGNKDDRKKCQEAREITHSIDWDCEVKTLFREKNLGCKIAVSSAIDWFFEHVESGIILEDDCVPDQSFFPFCWELLEKYKDDERVGMISGNNFISSEIMEKINPEADTYYFIHPVYIWGWATWKRAWKKNDMNLTRWPQIYREGLLREVYKNKHVVAFFTQLFSYAYSGRPNSWAIPWNFTCLVNKMLSIIPPRNLISNIGAVGVHSEKSGSFNNIPTKKIFTDNLKGPESVSSNEKVQEAILHATERDRFSWRVHFVNILDMLKLHGIVRYIYKRLHLKI